MTCASRVSTKIAVAHTFGKRGGHSEGDVPSVQHATDVDQR